MSTTRLSAHRLLTVVSLAAMSFASVSIATPAIAQAGQTASINVSSQPLDEALRAIEAQSGASISFDPDAVRGVTSRAVVNAPGPRAAIEAALDGTNLTVAQAADGSFDVFGGIVVIAQRDEAETRILVRQASTSDRNGLGLRDQPRNTQVISAKTIEDQQALNITDILRNAGGVSVQANNPNTGASYTVRGFNASGLVNGLSGGSQYGVQSGANQPIANIERVEVLKGPDALLSGFDNLGGNVNVVTKKPSAEPRMVVSLDVGSFGLVRGVIDGNSAISDDEKLSARIIASAQTMSHNYGGYTGNDDYVFAPTLRFKDRRTDIIVGASLSKSLSGITPFTIFNNQTQQLVERDPSIPIYSGDSDIGLRTDRVYFSATRELTPAFDVVVRGMHEDSALKLAVYQVGYNRQGVLVVDVSGSRQDGQTDALDGFVRFKAKLGDISARFNVGYNYSEGFSVQRSGTTFTRILNPPLGENTTLPVQPFPPLGNPLLRTAGKQEGVYGQGLIELWKIKVLGGLRKNWFESTTTLFFPGAPPALTNRKNGVTPNAGIIFDATKDLSIFANYSRGEQAVFTPGIGGVILPNIKTTNKEAGLKLDMFDERVTINASYFDIQQDNTIVPVLGGLASGPGQRGRGVDLNIAGQLLPGWTVLGSYTRTKYALLSTTPTQNTVARQPRDVFSLYSNYRTRIAEGVSGGGSVGLYGRSNSYADTLGRYVVPAARQVDVNAFLSVAGFDFNLGVRNVFDRRNYNTSSVISYIPVDEPRNVRLSVSKRLF